MDIHIPPDEARANKALLRKWLDERNRDPARAGAIDDRIRRTFGRTAAVLVLDMVGFSRVSNELGIIHYLAMIAEMEEAARPAVRAQGGFIVKQEADNLFALFDGPAQAIRAALGIFEGFAATNRRVPENQRIAGGVGIGYGPMLVIDDADVFGCEMNLACKLGEDTARPSEILLTAEAHAALDPAAFPSEPSRYLVGGEWLPCFRYLP